jgi:hypothetical protein
MPVLTPGRVVTLEFQETIRLGPREDKIEAVLEAAHRERKAVTIALTLVGKSVPPTSVPSSSMLAFQLKRLSRTMKNLISNLVVRVIVVMDDDTVFSFIWNKEANKFAPAFYSGGLPTV